MSTCNVIVYDNKFQFMFIALLFYGDMLLSLNLLRSLCNPSQLLGITIYRPCVGVDTKLGQCVYVEFPIVITYMFKVYNSIPM